MSDKATPMHQDALDRGESQRLVAREVGLSRNRVKKYLEVSESKRPEVDSQSRPDESLGPALD